MNVGYPPMAALFYKISLISLIILLTLEWTSVLSDLANFINKAYILAIFCLRINNLLTSSFTLSWAFLNYSYSSLSSS